MKKLRVRIVDGHGLRVTYYSDGSFEQITDHVPVTDGIACIGWPVVVDWSGLQSVKMKVQGFKEEEVKKDFDYKTIIGEMVGLSCHKSAVKDQFRCNPKKLIGLTDDGRLVAEVNGDVGTWRYLYHPSMEPSAEELAEKWADSTGIYLNGEMVRNDKMRNIKIQAFIAGRESLD